MDPPSWALSIGQPLCPTDGAREHSVAEWESQRERFTQLYVMEDKKLAEVRKSMQSLYGFSATERQYKRKIQAWKLDKNIKDSDMKIMLRKQLKRKLEDGKESEFLVNGRSVPPQKMCRYAQRKGMTDDEILIPQMPTPPHISCHTPTADKDIEQCSGGPAEGLDLPSPTNYTNGVRCETLEEKSTIVSESRLEPEIAIPIPSVRSLVLAGESKDNLMISEEQNTSALIPKTPGGPSIRALTTVRSFLRLDNIPWFKLRDQFQDFLKFGFPMEDPGYGAFIYDDLNDLMSDSYYGTIFGSPRAMLGSSHPKRTFESLGDVSEFAQHLLCGSMSSSTTQHIEENIQIIHSHLQLFILERHEGELLEGVRMIFGPVHKSGLLQFLSYVVNLLSNNLFSETESDKVVQWIDEIQGYEFLKSLLSIDSPTIEAFASNLLASALRFKNALITSIILQAGANPNSPMGYSGDYPLQYVARCGSTEIAQILLDAGADVNTPPAFDSGRTALQAAAGNGNIELVQILLDAGADVNAPPADYEGRTALQAAAGNGNIELVQILLDASADINALPADEYGRTALQAAVGNGNIELVQILLSASADINASSTGPDGRTALQAAARNGNIKLVQILLDASADINAPPADEDGYTALQAAADNKDIDLVQILLNAGADVDDFALEMAAGNGDIELVQILLDAGADINASPARIHGRTALQAAAENGNIELVQILLNAGADINAPPAEMGRTALQAVAEKENIELVQILLDAGADINVPPASGFGRTALQAAAENGNVELVWILLNAGADINAPPAKTQGSTALQMAAHDNNVKLVRILLNAGADVNAPPADEGGRTALQEAAWNGNIELVRILVDAGADVNIPPADDGGYTALQAAAIKGHMRIAQLLLNNNADVNAISAIKRGRTALEGAAEHGRLDMLQLLLNAGADTNGPQCTQYESAMKLASRYGRGAVCKLLKAHRDRS